MTLEFITKDVFISVKSKKMKQIRDNHLPYINKMQLKQYYIIVDYSLL